MALSAYTPTWTMVLTGLTTDVGASVTKITDIYGAQDRQFAFNLNKPSTISFTVPLDAENADKVLGLTNQEGYILLYKNGVIQMVAEIQTFQVNNDADNQGSIAISAMETMWVRLQKALVGRTSTGLVGPTTATDQGTWLADSGGVLSTYNAESGDHHTTIRTDGSITASGNITGGVWRFKPMMELIQELSASTAGFDFWQTPVDPSVNASGHTGKLNIAPLKGTTKAGVVFQYGSNNPNDIPNVSSYELLTDQTNLTTKVWILPPSYPDNSGLKVKSSAAAARQDTIGYREQVIPSEINADAKRQDIADFARTILRDGKQVFTFEPAVQDGSGLTPVFPDEYTTGDTIRARVIDHGVTLADVLVRVYGVQVNLDDTDTETDVLTLVNEA